MPARFRGAAFCRNQSDFEQEQTESTEAETTLFSVLSVISCSRNARIVRAI
jgi:hypothetical protein